MEKNVDSVTERLKRMIDKSSDKPVENSHATEDITIIPEKNTVAETIVKSSASAAEITEKRTFENNKDETSIILLLSQVYPDPDQPRTIFEKIEEKKVSLRRFGQIDPITVRYHPEKENCYMLVNGERRWTALIELEKEDPVKFSTIRATLRDDDVIHNEADRATIQHISNTHKDDMKPYEEYSSLKKIMRLNGFTKQSELAEHVGESTAKISKLFKFDKLTEDELKQVREGYLSATTIKNHGLEAAKVDAVKIEEKKIRDADKGRSEKKESIDSGETEKVKKPRVLRISLSLDVATSLALILQKISANKDLSPIDLGKGSKKELVAILEARSAEIADLL